MKNPKEKFTNDLLSQLDASPNAIEKGKVKRVL